MRLNVVIVSIFLTFYVHVFILGVVQMTYGGQRSILIVFLTSSLVFGTGSLTEPGVYSFG